MLKRIITRSVLGVWTRRALSMLSVAVLVLGLLPVATASAATFKPNVVYTQGIAGSGGSTLRTVDINSPSYSSNIQYYSGYPRLGYPDVNSAGTKVYYSIPGADFPVYEVNPDGTGYRYVMSYCSMPTVSPDGTRLACDNGNQGLRIASVANGSYTGVPVPYPGVSGSGVDWVDNDTVVFAMSFPTAATNPSPYCPGGGSTVARMDLNGANFQLLYPCETGPTAVRIHTSADGTRVTYVRNGVIWTMNIDGSNRRALATPPGDYFYEFPGWSPDGNWLIATAHRAYPNQNLGSRIVIMNASTGSIVTTMEQTGLLNEAAFLTSYTPPDTTPPQVTGTPDRGPDGVDNWYRADVTINWTATDPDPSSGAPTQPAPTAANLEGGHTYTSASSCDPKGNCATGSLPIKIDKTAPVLATPTWSASPKAINEQSVLTVPVNESTSGLLAGEYYIGDTDPGQSNGATMTVDGNTLTTTFGTDFTPGTYKINVRAKDKAGNWSAVAIANLEVYQPDTVAPNVTGTPDRNFDRNDWFNHDVTINWTAVDPDPSSGAPTQPAPTFANVEGVHTYTSDPSCDPASNCGIGSKTLNIDKTVPVIDFSLSQQPNAAGWNNQPVTVTFNCTDTGSGIETCTQPVTVSAEGGTIITGSAMDRAGNTTEINVVISLDTTPPTITQNVTPAPSASGWNNSDVTVTYACDDNLSGVAECSSPVTLSNDGAGQTATGTTTDVAGNVATITSDPINIDKTAPVIDFSLSQTPNAQGWNNGPVAVTFNCSDVTSGVASCTPPVTVTEEGGTIVTGTAVDGAGHVSEINVFIFIDSSLPDITSSATPAANSLSWNNTDVTVNFSCSDAVSGIASCSNPTIVTAEGVNQTVTGTAVDNAGNTNTTSRTVNLDKTAPVIGQFTWQTSTKATTATSQLSVVASDSLSGVTEAEYFIGDTDPGAGNGATMTVSGNTLTTTFGTDFPTGVYKISVRAKDAADNWSMAARGYLVVYNPNGPRMTGKADKNFIPSLANGDVLPNLLAGASDVGDFGFDVKYNNTGQIDTTSDLQFSYNTGTQCQSAKQAQNCHVFELNATSIEWLTTQGTNDSTGIFQGSAALNIDGAMSQVAFRLTGVDGDRISAATDSFQLQIFAAGADPNVATPVYKINPTNVDLKDIDIK